ncbi:MAG: hypothetical protein ACI97R_001130, partial [Candidatus Azotimanducaceae bacterium]
RNVKLRLHSAYWLHFIQNVLVLFPWKYSGVNIELLQCYIIGIVIPQQCGTLSSERML